jgi:hypothetical protein
MPLRCRALRNHRQAQESAQPWHDLDPAIPRFDQDPEMGFSARLELARSSLVKLGRRAGLLRRRGKRPAAATVEDSG